MSASDWKSILGAVMLFAIAALLPLSGSGYYLGLGITIAMFTVLATSWALFSGPTHYISLATAAFFGVGTYVTAMGFETLPLWSLIGLAGVIGNAGVNPDLPGLSISEGAKSGRVDAQFMHGKTDVKGRVGAQQGICTRHTKMRQS